MTMSAAGEIFLQKNTERKKKIVNNPRLKMRAHVRHIYAGPSAKTCVIEQRRDTPLTPERFTNPGPWAQACQA